jgi:hypothetical protein
MTSLKSLQIALFALILIFVVLSLTHVFRGTTASPDAGAWIEGGMAGMIVALGLWIGYRRIMIRANRSSTLKKTRNSALKWRWEGRHKREW